MLKWVSSRYKPSGGIVVTENGLPLFEDGPIVARRDLQRVCYLKQFLAQLAKAMREGVDVRGYFVWSLLDNFEWAFGYAKRFGAVHVDYETLVRTPKPVATWYRGVMRANAVVPTASEAALDHFAKSALDSRVDDW